MLTLIGLGAGDPDGLTRGAERALRETSQAMRNGRGALFVRTSRHPSVALLREWGLAFESLDAIYEQRADFASVYAAIADRVLAVAQQTAPDGTPFSIGFAVPGHPFFGEESVRLIRERAESLGIPVRVVASGSFVEAVLTAAKANLGDGCDIRDALTLQPFDSVNQDGFLEGSRVDSSRGLLLFQVFDQASASHAKLALMRDYPDDWEIVLVRAAGVPDAERITCLPLFQLDRAGVDHLTSVWVPPLPPSLRRRSFADLVGVMARLRAPNGCPWDREQTHATLKKYFVEETYEVLEAIDADDPDLLCEELGDALLQVVFHAQLAGEEGVFNIDDVATAIVEKLVRRHPHVFGTTEVSGSDDVLRNWEKIKRTEKTEGANPNPDWRPSVLDGVPRGLPALMAAMEISKRAIKVGFEWDSFADVLAKFDEEAAELKAELDAPTLDKAKIGAELGDLLFTIVQIARWQKLDPEDALRTMLTRFGNRFRYMETKVREQGRDLQDLPLAEQDALWNEAKQQ